MKFLQELDGNRVQKKSREKTYFNVKFHERFGMFLDALRRERLIGEDSVRVLVERGHCWANDVRTDGIILITNENPLLSKQSQKMIVGGAPAILEIFDHVLSRYATYHLKEDIAPEEVEIKPEYHEELNPAIWDRAEDGYRLKPDVREAMWNIINYFLKTLKMPQMEIDDAIITGSNANYNWTEDSDIDIHIIIDMDQAIQKYGDVVPEYLEAKRRLWSAQHDITIRGYPVEVYVQDEQEPHVSSGMYSLKEEKWLTEPKYEKPRYDDLDVRTKAAKWANEIDDLADSGICKSSSAEQMMDRLKKYRKAGLAKGGEFSVENLAFKYLRNNGFIEKLVACKQKGIDDQLSVEDEEWWKD